jgi:hypothetical protein
MFFATLATQILSRTTDLIDRSTRMNARLYVKAIIPIGLLFSLSLILSNVVYLYLSMAFVQMLKVCLCLMRNMIVLQLIPTGC